MLFVNVLVVIFVMEVNGVVDSLEQNPLYRGPTDCGEVLKNHDKMFSEYPLSHDAAASVNFLNMGDTCNPEAEVEFLREMQITFLNGTENSARMRLLVQYWESWRSHADSGSISGKRICNPKRMLECHRSTSKCVCRATMKLFDVNDFVNDELIELESVQMTKIVPHTQVSEEVEECRAKVDSICQWNVPWLGFCAIPCEDVDPSQPSLCVGQPNGAKRCRVCDPNEDIGDDKGKVRKCYQDTHRGISRTQSLRPLPFSLLLLVARIHSFFVTI